MLRSAPRTFLVPLCFVLVTAFFGVAFVFRIAHAAGTAADQMCKPFFKQCTCGKIPKVVDGKETCVDGGGPTANVNGCKL